jgi:hypothetical protein
MRRSRSTAPALAGFLAGGLALAAGCAAETDERPAEFPYIVEAILRPSCATATCHDAMTRREEIDFSTVEAASRSIDERGLVAAGRPEDSPLYFLITASASETEKRMPVDSPLPQADIDLIGAWIAAGAVR